MQEYYILQQEELLVLASLFDMDWLYGIDSERFQIEERIPYIIHQMYRNGIFVLRGEELFVQEPYKTIMKKIKEASFVLTAEKMEKGERKIWFYIGKSIISMEESRTDEKSVEISLIEKAELLQFLEECGFIPKERLDSELASIEEIQEVREKIDECLDFLQFNLFPTTPVEGEYKKELTLLCSKYNYWLRECHFNKEIFLTPYEKERMSKILFKWMEESENDFSGYICTGSE